MMVQVGKSWILALAAALALAAIVEGGQTEVVILQTSDIHGQLEATKNSGGVLRLATAIRAERTRSGKDAVIYIDCGDTLQGTIAAAITRGEAGIRALEILQPDAWILGNHDLDFGIARLKELLAGAQLPVLNGNLTIDDHPPFKAFSIHECNGARIAVIGMNTPHLGNWLWGKAYNGYRVEPALTTIKRIMPQIHRAKPHMIVLATHQGFVPGKRRLPDELRSIVDRFPEIDLILGGHTHREVPAVQVGRTYYVQPGARASHLARISATIDLERRTVVRLKSELIATNDLPPDPAAKKQLQPLLTNIHKFSNQAIVQVPVDISSKGTPGKNNHMSEVLCRAIAWYAKTPVVFHGTLSNWSWYKGELTERGLFAAIPYANGIGVAELTKDELTRIINEQLKFIGNYQMNGLYGIHADVDWKSKRVQSIDWPAGKTRITVAFNSYVIAGAGDRFPQLRKIVHGKDANLTEVPLFTRDVVRSYLKAVPQWHRQPERWLR